MSEHDVPKASFLTFEQEINTYHVSEGPAVERHHRNLLPKRRRLFILLLLRVERGPHLAASHHHVNILRPDFLHGTNCFI